MENQFQWFQKWYTSNFESKKNQIRIEITTVDNPGWYITIDLSDTEFQEKQFSYKKYENNELNWYFALKRNSNFEASGGPFNLVDILNIFSFWIENDEKKLETNLVESIQNWYINQCDGDWEHMFGVEIKSFEKQWRVNFDLLETIYENKIFNKFNIYINENDWFQCYIENGKFIGSGGAENLTDILQIFIDWINGE